MENLNLRDLYQQACDAHRHASDYRAKIIGGWSTVFTAFAGIYSWSVVNHAQNTWVVAIAGLVLNTMMWLADRRNRPAIGRAKDVGKAIEEKEEVEEGYLFFSRLDSKVSHSLIIDLFGCLSSGLFLGVFLVLLLN